MAQYISHIFEAHRDFLAEVKMPYHDWHAVQSTENHTRLVVAKIDYHPEPFGVASIGLREFKFNAIATIIFGHSSSPNLSSRLVTTLAHVKA